MTTSTRLLLASGLSGAGVMIFELSGTRALAPVFGSSLYTWTNLIAVVLLALALGYWLGGRLADRNPSPQLLGRILLFAGVLGIPSAFLALPLAQWLMPEPQALAVFDATPHVVRGSLAVTLLVFAPPLLLMGMVGPFVTRCLIGEGIEGGRASGRTLAVSTLGSLVGTILPAHLLIPQLGVRATLLCACALAVLAGLVCGIGGRARNAALALILLIPAAAAGVQGLPVLGTLDAGTPPWPGPQELAVEEEESPYQYLRVARWKVGDHEELRLALDEGVLEFHSVKPRESDGLTGSYYDSFALLPEMLEGEAPLSAAILGGGAGTMATLLRRHQDARMAAIVNVEIDPAVSALGPRFGWTPTGADRNVVADARVFLATSAKRWDLLVLDAYARQIAIPFHLATEEFFRLVADRLAEGGMVALNLSVVDIEGPLFQALHRSLKSSFQHTSAIRIPGSWNVMLLASARPLRLPEAKPGSLAALRKSFRAGFLPLDAPAADALRLSDDRAPLELLARKR